MTALALALILALDAPPEPATGWASAYAPGVMDDTVRYRLEHDLWRVPLPADWYTVAGYAATADCAQVGQIVAMRPAGATQWSRILIADCAGPDSWTWMIDNRIVAELDAATWTRWTAEYGRPLLLEILR
jgi:hypothetical protein